MTSFETVPQHAAKYERLREELQTKRIAELEEAIRKLVDMETDRYACGAHWRKTFDEARRVLVGQR